MSDEIREALPTYEDILDLPENVVGEIVAGEIHVSPRPGALHARASSVLGSELTGPFDRGRGGPGGWWILDEPELHLKRDVLVPDLAGWRRQRVPELPKAAHFEVVPDWVCEVVSPRTARLDRAVKMPAYATHQVGYLWMIDPEARTLEVFQLSEDRWRLESIHSAEEKIRAVPFDALELELDALWI